MIAKNTIVKDMDWDDQLYTNDIIVEFAKELLGWNFILKEWVLSENIIEKFSDKLDWFYVSQNLHLPNRVLVKYRDYINWEFIDSSCLDEPTQTAVHPYMRSWSVPRGFFCRKFIYTIPVPAHDPIRLDQEIKITDTGKSSAKNK